MSTDIKSREDRLVHALLPGKVELARYGISGRWYVEQIDGPKRQVVTSAVAAAVRDIIIDEGGSTTHYPSGQTMNRHIRKHGTNKDARDNTRRYVLAPFGVPERDLVNDIVADRAMNTTHQGLRSFVSENGGSILSERTYRYTPDQGGNGKDGKLTISFADRFGVEVGSVGFPIDKLDHIGRSTDFRDAQTKTSGYIHDCARTYLHMLSRLLRTSN